MVSKIIFKKIKFYNISYKSFDNYIVKKGLFVFPAGPALASIQKSNEYYKSIQKAENINSPIFTRLTGTPLARALSLLSPVA